ncbi:MAG TPA: tetratricopeptide repeat protein, partial [Pyrinomonadaceae bacterium]
VCISLASDGRGEESRLHPRFRGFLRRRFRAEQGRAAVAAEHARLAGFFLEREQWEQAMHHLVAAEDFDRAAQTVAERGGAWITAGALSSLASFADALPAQALEAHPRALAHRAAVARLRDEHDLAQSLFNRAAALLHEHADAEGEAEALHSLATIARRRGDCDTAFNFLDRAAELTDERSVVRTKCGNTRGLCLVGLGQWTEAEREFRLALQSAEERGDRYYARLIAHNLGMPSGLRGDFGESLRWLRRMLREEGSGAPPVPQEAIAHLNMARCHWHLGDFEACERHLDRALEICQLFNMTVLRGEIFEFYGNLYRERGELQRAHEFYERAARAYDEAGVDLARQEFLEERGLLALQLGDLAEARALLDRLIEGRAGDELLRQRALLARSRVDVAGGRYEEAAAVLREVLAYCRSTKLYYSEAQAALLLAVCEHALGHDAEVLGHLRRALRLRVLAPALGRAVPAGLLDAGGRGASADGPARAAPGARRRGARRGDGRAPGPRRRAAGPGRRPDHQHARRRRNLPRARAPARRRRVGHAPRARHPLLHRLAPPPPRLEGHDHRHLLGRVGLRLGREELPPDHLAHPQGPEQ